MNTYYRQGFIDKRAELGVDPKQLVKAAAPGGLLRGIKSFGQGAGAGFDDIIRMVTGGELSKVPEALKGGSRHAWQAGNLEDAPLV